MWQNSLSRPNNTISAVTCNTTAKYQWFQMEPITKLPQSTTVVTKNGDKTDRKGKQYLFDFREFS